MVYFLCYCECGGWRICMGIVLTWVVYLRWWRASVGDVPVWVMCWHGLFRQRARRHASVGGMGGASAWVIWTVC